MTRVGLVATASYLPERVLTAAELAPLTGVPETVLVEKFGLQSKHVAAADEHVSDLAVAAGARLLAENGVEPGDVDGVVYFGSTWKDYPVWQAAPHIAHRLGVRGGFALELDYVSCGSPVALRVARDMLAAEDELRSLLLVAASRESHVVDPTSPRSRFALTFGDGAVAALLVRGRDGSAVLGSAMRTDGSFSLAVKVPAGGSAEPASALSVAAGRHVLDVDDPAQLKERLDPVTLDHFVAVARAALKNSDADLDDIGYLAGIHVKPSMHRALCDALGVPLCRAAYLSDTGHMSGVDPLLAWDRALHMGEVSPGELVLLLAAGTGYTWAATAVRVGAQGSPDG